MRSARMSFFLSRSLLRSIPLPSLSQSLLYSISQLTLRLSPGSCCAQIIIGMCELSRSTLMMLAALARHAAPHRRTFEVRQPCRALLPCISHTSKALAEDLLGRYGYWCVLATNIVGPFTIMVSYQMIVGDMFVSIPSRRV